MRHGLIQSFDYSSGSNPVCIMKKSYIMFCNSISGCTIAWSVRCAVSINNWWYLEVWVYTLVRHDTWKLYPHYSPFVRSPTVYRWISLKMASNVAFFFADNQNFDILSSCLCGIEISNSFLIYISIYHFTIFQELLYISVCCTMPLLQIWLSLVYSRHLYTVLITFYMNHMFKCTVYIMPFW